MVEICIWPSKLKIGMVERVSKLIHPDVVQREFPNIPKSQLV